MKRFTSVLIILLIASGAGVLFLIQQDKIRQARAENDTLKQGLTQLEALREENSRLNKGFIDQNELAKLRAEHLELMRLRSEVAKLRRDRTQSQRTAAPTPAATESKPDLPAVEIFSANVRASIADNGTLITGGWNTQPGKRTLLLVTPEISSGDQGAAVIQFKTLLVEALDAQLTALGLDAVKAEETSSSVQRVFTPQDSEALFKSLQEAEGVEILAGPSVTTRDGQQAQVQMMDKNTVPGVELGPSIEIIPHLQDDGASVDVTVHGKLNALKRAGQQ